MYKRKITIFLSLKYFHKTLHHKTFTQNLQFERLWERGETLLGQTNLNETLKG